MKFVWLKKLLIYCILVPTCIIVLLPIIWIVLASFSEGNSLYNAVEGSGALTLNHYKELLGTTNFALWYFNTVKIATINMILSVILSLGSAYVFSRFRFKGRKTALTSIMIMQMFPSMMGMIATYVLMSILGLFDTHLGLILVYAGGQIPYNTWLVKGYFDGIPRSLDEAAKMDGASNVVIFTKVIIPVTKPIITYLALTNFIAPWMDFMLPQLLLRSEEKKTLAIALFGMVSGQQNTQFTNFAAGAVMVAAPITLLYLFLQRYIVEGLTAGSSKS